MKRLIRYLRNLETWSKIFIQMWKVRICHITNNCIFSLLFDRRFVSSYWHLHIAVTSNPDSQSFHDFKHQCKWWRRNFTSSLKANIYYNFLENFPFSFTSYIEDFCCCIAYMHKLDVFCTGFRMLSMLVQICMLLNCVNGFIDLTY